MKYSKFILFFILFVSCNSPDSVKEVTYRQIELTVPSTWNYKTQEIENDFVYQVSCWEKGGANSFAIRWIEAEIDLDKYLNQMKVSLSAEETHTNSVFNNNRIGNFQNHKTLYSTFSGELLDLKFRGKLTAFNNNGRTYLLLHQGTDEFFNSNTVVKILSSLKLNHAHKSEARKEEPTKLEAKKGWIIYKIGAIGEISIPAIMELRNENSVNALRKEIIKEAFVEYYKIDIDKLNYNLVFEPKGTNKLEKEAKEKYARVLIKYQKGKKDEFPRCDEKMTSAQLTEVNKVFYKQYVDEANQIFNKNIIKQWEDVRAIDVNGISGLTFGYVRTGLNNTSVKVITYNFYNSEELVVLVISYRMSETELWSKDLSQIASTFNFSIRR